MTYGGKSDDVSAIRQDIDRTRADMSRTVNAIEERLSPAHIKEQITSVKEHVVEQLHDVKDQAKAKVREATVGRVEHMVDDARHTVTDAGSSVLETIKANPVPAALVAVGLGWLIMGGKSSKSSRRDQWYGYGEGGPYEGIDEDGYAFRYRTGRGGRRVGGPRRVLRDGQRAIARAGEKVTDEISTVGHKIEETASGLADGAKHMLHDAGESVSHAAHDAGVAGKRVARRVGRGARRAEQSFESTLRENPLAVGAVAVAIGAAIGLLLPHTKVEDDLVGKTKDRLLEKAEGTAKDALGKVSEKVEAAVGQLAAGDSDKENKDKPGENGLVQAPRSQPNGFHS